jgi:hypothetical protein
MIAFEALFLFLAAALFITLIGRPLAKAYSERIRVEGKTMTPEDEQKMLSRVSALEEELRQTKQRLDSVQAAAEYAIKLIETQTSTSDSQAGNTIDLTLKSKKKEFDQ